MEFQNFIDLFNESYEVFANNHVKYTWKYGIFLLQDDKYYIHDFDKDDAQENLK